MQSIAQAGLTYGKDAYDKERYAQVWGIAAEMLTHKTDFSLEKVKDLFCNESGYQTPKLDTRAAIFEIETTGVCYFSEDALPALAAKKQCGTNKNVLYCIQKQKLNSFV